jgi:hypothetical protein
MEEIREQVITVAEQIEDAGNVVSNTGWAY